jgi:hypothetical protein
MCDFVDQLVFDDEVSVIFYDVDPFCQAPMLLDLSVELQRRSSKSIVLIVHYFGRLVDRAVIKQIRESGGEVIEDFSHCGASILEDRIDLTDVKYGFSSLRKTLPVRTGSLVFGSEIWMSSDRCGQLFKLGWLDQLCFVLREYLLICFVRYFGCRYSSIRKVVKFFRIFVKFGLSRFRKRPLGSSLDEIEFWRSFEVMCTHNTCEHSGRVRMIYRELSQLSKGTCPHTPGAFGETQALSDKFILFGFHNDSDIFDKLLRHGVPVGFWPGEECCGASCDVLNYPIAGRASANTLVMPIHADMTSGDYQTILSCLRR